MYTVKGVAYGQNAPLPERVPGSELFEQLIAEHAQDLVSLVAADGTCLFLTPVIRTMLGYEPEEIIGRRTDDLYKKSDQTVLLQRQDAAAMLPDEGTVTYRAWHKNGHPVWLETNFKRVRNVAGEVDYVFGITRDITHRKDREAELQATQVLFESFLAHSVDAILLCNSEGDVLRVNQMFETMFGWTEQEVLNREFRMQKIIPPHLQEEVAQYEATVKRGTPVFGYETVRLTKAGEQLDVHISLSPMHGGDGQVSGYSVTFRDITERKRTQQLLLQSEKLSIAGQLAAGVAHEIRNPLTALIGFVQLMQRNGKENSTYLEVMSSELARIELIISELLMLAKPQAITYHPQDVTRLLQDVITLIETQAIMNNIQVVTEFAQGLPSVHCDENQLKQVFINFLKNAIDAMPTGGTMTIAAQLAAGSHVRLRFVDEGCGISPELIARVGEPFYTTKEKGTGLGMMVSKKIIESHRGKLLIFSEPMQGTTIELLLPVALPVTDDTERSQHL